MRKYAYPHEPAAVSIRSPSPCTAIDARCGFKSGSTLGGGPASESAPGPERLSRNSSRIAPFKTSSTSPQPAGDLSSVQNPVVVDQLGSGDTRIGGHHTKLRPGYRPTGRFQRINLCRGRESCSIAIIPAKS